MSHAMWIIDSAKPIEIKRVIPMSKIKLSVRPYLAGFLHIDLAVMTTCAASLALLLAL